MFVDFIIEFVNFLNIKIALYFSVSKWLIGYCCSAGIPAFYFVYIYILAMNLFIPITGRSGPNINPELLVGVLSALLCSLIFAYIVRMLIPNIVLF